MLLNLKEDLGMAVKFQRLLKGILLDYDIFSWQLVIAHSWAMDGKLRFVWFPEYKGVTFNGVAIMDSENNVVLSTEAGFSSDDEKLMQEAMLAHILMHDATFDGENDEDN